MGESEQDRQAARNVDYQWSCSCIVIMHIVSIPNLDFVAQQLYINLLFDHTPTINSN